MKNNDIYFDENPKLKEMKLKSKSNNNKKKDYKNIFLCPLNKNDCVNSIDIFEDIILYGTIMGNVYLCRANKNNLYQDINQEIYINESYQSDINNLSNNKNQTQYEIKQKYKIEEKDTSKISCIKLNTNNSNLTINNHNQFDRNENETLKINNNNKKEIEKIYFESDLMPKTKSGINNLKLQGITTKQNLLKILENKNIKYEKGRIYKNSFIKKDIIPFPQVTQLIINAKENIPCVSFDTKDIVNLSIGDYEIIRLKNMSSFNINDDNSNYTYIRIKNYVSENEHIKKCENTTCMMTDKNFLIVYTIYAENDSQIQLNKVNYQNKNMISFEVVEGEIEMYNYSIPFDFDGDRFLFVDYESDALRRICINYTLSKKEPFIYKISKGFGHINYMKFLLRDKVFLCKNQKICEIYKIDENFILLESWVHNGEEIIAMNVYIEGTKDNELFSDDSYTNLSFKKYNENESQTIEIIKKGNNSKRKKKYNHLDDIYISPKNINVNSIRKSFEKENFSNSTLRDLNLNDNKKSIKNSVKLKNDKGDGLLPYNFNSEIDNRINRFGNEEEDDVIEIYSEYKNPQTKEITSTKEYKKNTLNKFIDESKFFKPYDKNKELIKRSGSYDYYIQDKNKPTERSLYQNEKKIYILTVDLNGNFNLYYNNKNKIIFNLYDISNIDSKYKEETFFSMGFPYYVTMNSKYYAISTDFGIFVLSNKV